MHIRSMLLGCLTASAVAFAIADEGDAGGVPKVGNVEGDVNINQTEEDVTKPATDTPSEDIVGGETESDGDEAETENDDAEDSDDSDDEEDDSDD